MGPKLNQQERERRGKEGGTTGRRCFDFPLFTQPMSMLKMPENSTGQRTTLEVKRENGNYF